MIFSVFYAKNRHFLYLSFSIFLIIHCRNSVNFESVFSAFCATITGWMLDHRARPQVVKPVSAGCANDFVSVKGFRLPDSGFFRINLDMKPQFFVQKRHASMEKFAVSLAGRKARVQQLMGNNVDQRSGVSGEKKMPAERETALRIVGPRDVAGAVFADAARDADGNDLAKTGGQSRLAQYLFNDRTKGADKIPSQQPLFPKEQVACERLLRDLQEIESSRFGKQGFPCEKNLIWQIRWHFSALAPLPLSSYRRNARFR